MYLKLIAIFMGGLFLSTSLIAAEPKAHPPVVDKNPQDNLTKEHLRELEQVHHHNAIFDDYHTGGTPYTPYKTIKGK